MSYHAHSDEGFPLECLVDSFKGFGLGLAVWVVPVSVLYRRLTGLRRGLAIGLFFGSFRVVSCSLFRVLATVKTGRQLTDLIRRFVNAIAGFVSGAIFSSIDTDVRNAVFVLWICIRAIRALMPAVPFADVLVMCFSASGILSTYVHSPTDHAKSYQGFLHKFGGKTSEQLAHYRTADGLGPANLCPIIHPNQGCFPHFLTFTAEGLMKSVIEKEITWFSIFDVSQKGSTLFSCSYCWHAPCCSQKCSSLDAKHFQIVFVFVCLL